jgi:hypothetical protein
LKLEKCVAFRDTTRAVVKPERAFFGPSSRPPCKGGVR